MEGQEGDAGKGERRVDKETERSGSLGWGAVRVSKTIIILLVLK